MAIDYDNLKDQIAAKRQTISSIRGEISAAESTASRLDREKTQLQTSISLLHSNIQSHKSTQIDHRSQIQKLGSVQTSVSHLKTAADSVTVNIKDMASELLQLKQALNQCASALDDESTEIRIKSSKVDMLVLRRSRQRREFEREKQAIMQVTESLRVVVHSLPGLLPGSSMKFLDIKPAPRSSTSPIMEDIPGIKLRKN
jgi:chromosome segregation ATPase